MLYNRIGHVESKVFFSGKLILVVLINGQCVGVCTKTNLSLHPDCKMHLIIGNRNKVEQAKHLQCKALKLLRRALSKSSQSTVWCVTRSLSQWLCNLCSLFPDQTDPFSDKSPWHVVIKPTDGHTPLKWNTSIKWYAAWAADIRLGVETGQKDDKISRAGTEIRSAAGKM